MVVLVENQEWKKPKVKLLLVCVISKTVLEAQMEMVALSVKHQMVTSHWFLTASKYLHAVWFHLYSYVTYVLFYNIPYL